MSKNKEPKIVNIKIVRMQCQLWSKAILTQISRISKNKNTSEYNKKLQRLADENLLRISLYKLYEWIKYIDNYIEGTDSFIDEFNKLFNIKLLRNISEHPIDYYSNIGDNQDKFINLDTHQSLLMSSIVNRKHYLSGKIDTSELKKLIKQIDGFFESNTYKLKLAAFSVLNELAAEQII